DQEPLEPREATGVSVLISARFVRISQKVKLVVLQFFRAISPVKVFGFFFGTLAAVQQWDLALVCLLTGGIIQHSGDTRKIGAVNGRISGT
ncbi:hypothetical protein U1Q18_032221, partial [Sarracenia purpurea var. burkii]